MGTYVYTLRKRFVMLNILGEQHKVHAFSYLMKPHWEETTYEKLAIAKAASMWEGQELPRFCYNGDWEDLMKSEPLELTTDLRSHIWWDCNKFPGTAVGGIVREGRKYRFLTSREYLIECNKYWPSPATRRRFASWS